MKPYVIVQCLWRNIRLAKVVNEAGEIVWRRRSFHYLPEEYPEEEFGTFAEFFTWNIENPMIDDEYHLTWYEKLLFWLKGQRYENI